MNWISIYEKLVSFAKENIWVIIFFWLASAILLFLPAAWLSYVNLSEIPKNINIFIGLFFVSSSCLLIVRAIQFLHDKRCLKIKREQMRSIALKLENLLEDDCFSPNPFYDKEACVKWANKVGVLLQGNSSQYDEWIVHKQTMLQTHDLFDGMGYLISRMRSMLDLAVREINEKTNNKNLKVT